MERPAGSRELPCCDCGSVCLMTATGILLQLYRPYLVICTVCAKHREIECGGTGDWTRDVRPIPRAS